MDQIIGLGKLILAGLAIVGTIISPAVLFKSYVTDGNPRNYLR